MKGPADPRQRLVSTPFVLGFVCITLFTLLLLLTLEGKSEDIENSFGLNHHRQHRHPRHSHHGDQAQDGFNTNNDNRMAGVSSAEQQQQQHHDPFVKNFKFLPQEKPSGKLASAGRHWPDNWAPHLDYPPMKWVSPIASDQGQKFDNDKMMDWMRREQGIMTEDLKQKAMKGFLFERKAVVKKLVAHYKAHPGMDLGLPPSLKGTKAPSTRKPKQPFSASSSSSPSPHQPTFAKLVLRRPHEGEAKKPKTKRFPARKDLGGRPLAHHHDEHHHGDDDNKNQHHEHLRKSGASDDLRETADRIKQQAKQEIENLVKRQRRQQREQQHAENKQMKKANEDFHKKYHNKNQEHHRHPHQHGEAKDLEHHMVEERDRQAAAAHAKMMAQVDPRLEKDGKQPQSDGDEVTVATDEPPPPAKQKPDGGKHTHNSDGDDDDGGGGDGGGGAGGGGRELQNQIDRDHNIKDHHQHHLPGADASEEEDDGAKHRED